MTPRVEALLRRQLLVTGLALLALFAVWAFAQSQGSSPAPHGPVDVYVQAHQPPHPGSLRLAYLQLFVTAAVALVVLGHAARVVAFVFRREVN
jgi:hypothetical protein